MSELLDSLTTTVGRGLPEQYVAREVMAVANKALKLHNKTSDDLAEAVGLVERLRDHLDGCSHGYPDELWDDANAFLDRLAKDTP